MAQDAYRIGRDLAGRSRATAFAIVVGAYALAALAGMAVAGMLSGRHPITVLFWADLAATVVIFGLSMMVGNSSLYDPYWSVAPPLIVGGWLAAGTAEQSRVSACAGWLVLVLIIDLGGAAHRQLGAWAGGACGHEDWRYVQHPRRGPGPAAVVAGQLHRHPADADPGGVPRPAVGLAGDHRRPAARAARRAGDRRDLVIAIGVETVADLQLRRFAADPGQPRQDRRRRAVAHGRGTRTTSARSRSGGGCGCSGSPPPRTGGGPSSARWRWSRCSSASAFR